MGSWVYSVCKSCGAHARGIVHQPPSRPHIKAQILNRVSGRPREVPCKLNIDVEGDLAEALSPALEPPQVKLWSIRLGFYAVME